MRSLILLLVCAAGARAGTVAFIDVAVVPMDREGVVGPRTVVVRDGKILAVGDKVYVPKDAVRVNGRGKFLMPGLADMHVHFWYEEEHVLFVANGVTTVRNLWGKRMHLRWRDEVRSGKRLGPNVYTTGPILDGKEPIWENSEPVTTAAEAEAIVRRLKREGYPSIKIYNKLRPDIYHALVKACRAHGLRVSGHVPYAVAIEDVLAAKQDCIEHLDGYFGRNWNFDPKRLDRLVQQTVAAGTWNCPTLVVYQKFVPIEEAKKLHAAPEMRFVPPRLRATWDPTRDFRLRGMKPEHFVRLRAYIEQEFGLVKRLHDAGAGLMLGTDAGNPFVIAGWSAHQELANLIAAGLTPYQALRVATVNAARYLGEEGKWGAVRSGMRADLLLVEANPLQDVGNARKIAGVMVRGRWLPRATLDEKLNEVAHSYTIPKRRFAKLPPLPKGDVVRYDITWNGLVVGQERFVRVGDTLHVQQVNDPPWSSTRFVTIRLDAAGKIHSLAAVRRDLDGTKSFNPTAVDGDACFASWLALGRRWRDLKVGATRAMPYRQLGEKEIEQNALEVRRDGPRAFTVKIKRKDGVFTSKLVFDDDWIPASLETVLQLGTVRYRRVP